MRRFFAVAALFFLGSCDRNRSGDFGPPCINCHVVQRSLAPPEVKRIVTQAVAEAAGQNRCVTIAVVDRVGDVLAVFDMNAGSCAQFSPNVRISSGYEGRVDGLEGVSVPGWEAAIAKAVTGAYLSSAGNAFSSRTASYIIQENFPPGTRTQASGPLFGVQFSQLSCSDVMQTRLVPGSTGPQRSPLGLAGSPGGLPLYKAGVLVGGIGVTQRAGRYGLDLDPASAQENADELVAVAGTFGFTAPEGIRGDHISVGAATLRFTASDTTVSNPALAREDILLAKGTLLDAPGFYDVAGEYRGGAAFGTIESGIVPDVSADFSDLSGYVLTDSHRVNRFPPIAGASGLSAIEVKTILRAALSVAIHTRGQIRHPLGSTAQVTISVVDANGDLLGLVRTPDAPVFGIDVSAQKARTAALFSRNDASALLLTLPGGIYFDTEDEFDFLRYVSGSSAFFGGRDPFDGTAFSARSIGNLARPFYPDGIEDLPYGPLSKQFGAWSPFNVGLQLDMSYRAILAGATAPTTAANAGQGCTGNPRVARSGLQIFPGGFPIYRNGYLAGGIGVSGDGTSQDDMIGFLGLYDAGVETGTVGHPAASKRADTLSPQGSRLRYAACPVSPFVDSTTGQNVCDGK